MRILLIEDEQQLAEAIAEVLKQNKYSVDLAFDGETGLAYAESGLYDLIISDLMLPKLDGLSLIRRLREQGSVVPILMLTAKASTNDKIFGLDCGADDYLTKPFEMGELLARLRALGRRKGSVTPNPELCFHDLALNPHSLVLRCQHQELTLTLKEAQLLEFLLNHPDQIVAKTLIIEKIWGYDSQAEDNHVEVYISFLRKKLVLLASTSMITTIRGSGYRLNRQ